MKLTDEEKHEMLEDGRDLGRREEFRVAAAQRILTFESYLAALDDLLSLRPIPHREPKRYINIRL